MVEIIVDNLVSRVRQSRVAAHAAEFAISTPPGLDVPSKPHFSKSSCFYFQNFSMERRSNPQFSVGYGMEQSNRPSGRTEIRKSLEITVSQTCVLTRPSAGSMWRLRPVQLPGDPCALTRVTSPNVLARAVKASEERRQDLSCRRPLKGYLGGLITDIAVVSTRLATACSIRENEVSSRVTLER